MLTSTVVFILLRGSYACTPLPPVHTPGYSSESNTASELIPLQYTQVVYKDMMAAPVASILSADYRMGGCVELLVIGADGEVRGYVPTAPSPASGESLASGTKTRVN